MQNITIQCFSDNNTYAMLALVGFPTIAAYIFVKCGTRISKVCKNKCPICHKLFFDASKSGQLDASNISPTDALEI
jgi:hypothetical protein